MTLASSTSTKAQPPRRISRRRMMYSLFTMLLIAVSSYVNVVPVFRDDLQHFFQLDEVRYGLILSIGAIPGAIMALLAGVAVDRYGAARIMALYLLGAGASFCGIALSSDSWTRMLVALAAAGAFVQGLNVVGAAYLVKLFPLQGRRILSINLAIWAAAGMVLPIVAEWMIQIQRTNEHVRFATVLHVPFAILGALMMLAAPLYVWRLRRRNTFTSGSSTDETGVDRSWSIGSFFSYTPGQWLLLLVLIIHGTCDCALYAWIPKVLGGPSFEKTVIAPGIVMSAFAMVYLVSRIALAAVPEGKFDERWLLVIPGLLGGSLLFAGLLSRNQGGLSAGYVLGGLCWSLEYPIALGIFAAQAPRKFGSGMALVGLITGFGNSAMTYFMGLLGAHLGPSKQWMILMTPAFGFMLVGVCGWLWVMRLRKENALVT